MASNGPPLPEQDIIKEYSNYSNLHNETQIQTNTGKQHMGYLSTKRTTKDNQKQAVPYPALGTFYVPQPARVSSSGTLAGCVFVLLPLL